MLPNVFLSAIGALKEEEKNRVLGNSTGIAVEALGAKVKRQRCTLSPRPSGVDAPIFRHLVQPANCPAPDQRPGRYIWLPSLKPRLASLFYNPGKNTIDVASTDGE